MSLPAPFHGRADESLRQFLFKLGNARKIIRAEDDRAKILVSGKLLEGKALDWYLDLLRENAQEEVANNNYYVKYARAHGEDDDDALKEESLKEYDPTGWAKYEFCSLSLHTWDAFLKAIWDKFGPEPKADADFVPNDELSSPTDESDSDNEVAAQPARSFQTPRRIKWHMMSFSRGPAVTEFE